MININKSESQEIIKELEDIPHLVWLFFCEQPDQKEEWFKLKLHFTRLHDSLKAYFSGQETPLQSLPKKQMEFYSEWTDYYLALYDVLQWGWKYIKKADPDFPFDYPGQALIAIIETTAAGMFAPCQLPYYEWSAKAAYDEHRLRRQETATQTGRKLLNNRQQNKLAKLSATSDKRDAYAEPLLSLLKFCLNACQVGDQSDSIMKRKLQDFRKHADQVTNTLVISFLRKSKGRAWDKGTLKKSAPGSVYK